MSTPEKRARQKASALRLQRGAEPLNEDLDEKSGFEIAAVENEASSLVLTVTA